MRRRASNRHDFFFLVSEVSINLPDIIVRELLQLFFGMLDVVLGGAAIVGVFFELFHGIAADVANRHATILGHFADDFHEFLAPFLAQLWKKNTDRFSL